MLHHISERNTKDLRAVRFGEREGAEEATGAEDHPEITDIFALLSVVD